MRVVVLNSVVLRPGLLALAEEVSHEEVMELLKRAEEVESYVGHGPTAALLGIPCFRGEYVPRAGDVVVVVRLRGRRQVPGDVEVGLEDLQFLRLGYVEVAELVRELQLDGWSGSEEGLKRRILGY